jgi:hypothetical protein
MVGDALGIVSLELGHDFARALQTLLQGKEFFGKMLSIYNFSSGV